MTLYQRISRLALTNLVIVSAAGVLLRYKIVFPLRDIDHKNLLHAHSHFAFSAWVSLALCVAMVSVIAAPAPGRLYAYSRLFILMQTASLGMLFTFPFMGYKAPSIVFSTLSILLSYLFTWFAWKDMNRSSLPSYIINWFKAALFFYAFSSLGAFHLAWMMASKTGSQPLYIGSVYFFLHFQYNGWFSFAIMGLFFHQLWKSGIAISAQKVRIVFLLLFCSCIPAFLLSALWMRLPALLESLGVLAAFVQLLALLLLFALLSPCTAALRGNLEHTTRWLWIFSGIAFVLKILLQGLSTIPALSYLAFGFRPIVIGYLHLILLCFVTFFIIGYLAQQGFLQSGKLPGWGRAALFAFVGGAVINELLLMTQGIAAIDYINLPWINYCLLGMAVLMFGGLALFLLAQWKCTRSIHETA